MFAAPRPAPVLPVQLLAVTAVLLAMPDAAPNAVLSGLAIAAALLAHREGRSRSLRLAAAIAAGLAPVGLVTLPLMLGDTIRRGAGWALVPVIAAGAAAWLTTGGWPQMTTIATFFTLASATPALAALIAAGGIGAGASIAADAASSRPTDSASRAILLLGLFVPVPVAAVIAPLMACLALPATTPRRPRAANDDPVFPRAVRLAA